MNGQATLLLLLLLLLLVFLRAEHLEVVSFALARSARTQTSPSSSMQQMLQTALTLLWGHECAELRQNLQRLIGLTM
jgi:hypothetical protein